jgi:hypothetical protein
MKIRTEGYQFIKNAAELVKDQPEYVYPSAFDTILEEMGLYRSAGWIPYAVIREYRNGSVSIEVEVETEPGTH